MNHGNYNSHRLDNPLKKSILTESYTNVANQNSHNRSSLSKRPSFTTTSTTSQFSIMTQHPKTPKPVQNTSSNPHIPFSMQNFTMPAQYFHQSSYVNHSYQIQPIQHCKLNSSRHDSLSNRSQTSLNKYQLTNNKNQFFNSDQKSNKQAIQDIIQKLEKTISQVEKHDQILRNHQFNLHPNNKNSKSSQFISKIVQETLSDYSKAKQIQTMMHHNLMKNQIQSMKQQITNLSSNMSSRDVQDRIKKIGEKINRQIQKVSVELKDNLINMIQVQKKDRKKQVQKIRSDLQMQINNYQKRVQQKYRIINEKESKLTLDSHSQQSFTGPKSKKQFIGDPILVKFATKVSISVRGSNRDIQDAQTIYKIDNQGYLLDSECKYILNNKYEQIKLTNEQIDIMKQKGFLR